MRFHYLCIWNVFLISKPRSSFYDEMIELCQIADRGGMHAVWTGEHHAMNFTIAPNPF